MHKLLLGLGTLTAIIVPTITVISCGGELSKSDNEIKKEFKEEADLGYHFVRGYEKDEWDAGHHIVIEIANKDGVINYHTFEVGMMGTSSDANGPINHIKKLFNSMLKEQTVVKQTKIIYGAIEK